MNSIGRVISVFLNRVEIEVYNDLIDGFTVIQNKLHNIVSVGNYCKIYNNSEFLIVRIINEKASLLKNTDSAKKVKDNYYKTIEGLIIGSLKRPNFTFEFGISRMPNIFSNVFSLTKEELKKVLNSQSTENVLQQIGTFLENEDVNFYIDVNDFLKYHSSIFGITGSGKSFTIGKVLETIYDLENSKVYEKRQSLKIFLFDITGEYKALINRHNRDLISGVSFKKYKIPIQELDYTDWSYLLHASKKTQEPFLKWIDSYCKNISNWDGFKNAIVKVIRDTMENFAKISKNDTEQNHKFKVIRHGLSNLVTGKSALHSYFQEISNFFDDFELKYGNQSFRTVEFKNINDFIKEIEKVELKPDNKFFLTIEYFDILFKLKELNYQMIGGNLYNNIKYLTQRYEQIKGELSEIFAKTQTDNNLIDHVYDTEQSLINIFDLSKLNSMMSIGLAGVVTSKVYAKKKIDKKGKLIFLFDEAHRYMGSNSSDNYENKTEELLNEISKEGRKYGVSLIIASQKPSDISETILSQCSNFIIHKIISPYDIGKLGKIIAYLDERSSELLSYLKPGCAIFAGRFQELPQIVKISEPTENFKPDSSIDDIYFWVE